MWTSVIGLAWTVLRPLWVFVLPYIGPVIEIGTRALGPVGLVLGGLSPVLRYGLLIAAVAIPLWLLFRGGDNSKLIAITEVQRQNEVAARREAGRNHARALETLRLREAQNENLRRELAELEQEREALNARLSDPDLPVIRSGDGWMRQK